MQVKSFNIASIAFIVVTLLIGRGGTAHAEPANSPEVVGAASMLLSMPSALPAQAQFGNSFRPLALRAATPTNDHTPGAVYVNGADHFNFITFSTPRQMLVGGDQVRIPLNAIFGRINCQVQWEPQLASLTGLQKGSTPITTEGVHFLFSMASIRVDRSTLLTNGLTVGQSYDSDLGHNVETTYANVALTRQLPSRSTIALKYTYRDDPRGQDLNARPGYVDAFEPWAGHPVQSRVSLDFAMTSKQKIKFFASLGNNLTFADHSLYTSLTCPLNKDWGVGISNSRHQYTRMSAERTELWVARRLMGRTVLLAYSPDTSKFRVDFANIKF